MTVSMPPASQMTGELLDGRYQVGDVLGRGGHGVVYRAHDCQKNIPVAIKFLHPEFAKDPEFNMRMLREVQTTNKLQGSSAIQIYALRADSNGSLFMVMELLKGHDLGEHLERWENTGQFLPIAHLPYIFAPLIRTLEFAHNAGVVHRDLKPSNIFILDEDAGGGVKLLDFGLAKVMSASPLTRQGMVAGSPSYIAPEVWKGNPAELDHHLDIYSMGAMLFRVIAGQPPFSGSLLELMQAALSAQRPSLYRLRPDVLPPEIDDWVAQALAIQKDARFSKIRALWNSLCYLLQLPVN